MKKTILLFALLLLFPSAAFTEEESKTYTATIAPDGKEHITITGGSYFFRPNKIVVKVNVPVELTVVAEPSIIPHAFVLKAPSAGIDISTPISTISKVFEFTPTGTGEYKFYCDKKFLFFKSHREHGMEGTLTVVE
jgi:plastocyanin domain-containing protein